MILISIIIPTYNRKLLLEAAVESSITQSCRAIEIIVVDDGSTDGTDRMMESNLKGKWGEHNIQYVVQKNAGACVARNKGLALAKGDYVQFLDSDDELLPNKLEKQLELLERPGNESIKMCYCYGRMGESKDEDYQRIGVQTASVDELLLHLVSRTTHVMQTSAALWRRSFLAEGEGWRQEMGFGDDLEYSVRLVARLDAFAFIDEEYFLVRVHSANRLSADTMTRDSLHCAMRTQQSIYRTLCDSGYRNNATMHAFVGAVRIVYANSLQYGTIDDIERFEDWLTSVGASDPAFRALNRLISARRILGAKFLMCVHEMIMKLRRRFRQGS